MNRAAIPSPAGPKTRRAAVYVRMSTEHQQYSTSNQMDVIREFACLRGLEIVREYSDEGKSGLSIEGRDSLTRMLVRDFGLKVSDGNYRKAGKTARNSEGTLAMMAGDGKQSFELLEGSPTITFAVDGAEHMLPYHAFVKGRLEKGKIALQFCLR